MTIFFTSDHHFGHANIIKYCSRPFSNIEQMTEELITRHNSVVKPDDRVYFLGDFMFKGDLEWIAARLNGTKFIVVGNHDHNNDQKLRSSPQFEWVKDYYELTTQHPLTKEKLLIVMSHYPFATWNRAHHGAYMLHGHSHGTYKIEKGRILDVGVDTHNWYPWSLEDVCTYMSHRNTNTVDHHRDRHETSVPSYNRQ